MRLQDPVHANLAAFLFVSNGNSPNNLFIREAYPINE
jgi:hypothetical protein